MNKDLEHLKLLSIFHYVLAGLCIFPLLYGLFYMAMGIFFGVAISNVPGPKDGPPPALFMGIFVVIGLVISVFSLAFALVLLKAGKNLKSLRGYTFCLVIAGISCLLMPFGTVLGVFTLVVLMRDSVKSLFNGGSATTNYHPQGWQQ